MMNIFIESKAEDKAYDEADDEADDDSDYKQLDITDMPDLESEESAEQGLKLLTPDQMVSRLPISIAQLKAVINSEKLKNRIRQLLYSFYRSKKINQNNL